MLPAGVHRRFGETAVGTRVSDPRASVSDQEKTRGFGRRQVYTHSFRIATVYLRSGRFAEVERLK